MKEKIEAIIERALEREERAREIGVYYPSELSFCIRNLFYRYLYPKKFKLGTLKIFELGTLIHGWFHDLFRDADLINEHYSEGSVVLSEKDFQIRGRFDDLFLLKMDSQKVLVEIKTTMNNRFVNKAKEHHKMQLMFYLNRLDMNKGFIVYVDRRSLGLKVFEIGYDENVFKELVERARVLHDMLVLKIAPKKEAKIERRKKGWMCDYCMYTQECAFDENFQKNKDDADEKKDD